MSRHNFRRPLFSQGFFWQLSSLHIIMVTSAILLSGLAVYNTACILVGSMGYLDDAQQQYFNTLLFNYLLIFSAIIIILCSMLHYYLLKRLTKPVRNLIRSTEKLNRGEYPDFVDKPSRGEIGKLIGHFNVLIQQLKLNDERRENLVSDISHELRTPLTNLNGYLLALEKGDVKGSAELYHALRKESGRLTDIIEQMEQLKEWGDVSSSPYSHREHVDMAGLIDGCVGLYRWRFEEEDIQIVVSSDSCFLLIDAERIQQVVNNLIDNAINYYERPGTIEINSEHIGGLYRVSVSGPGIGIPESEHDNIFRRFYRLDASRDRKTGGSGLGLAIAREIIEQHNGHIGVSSTADSNLFWFQLPVDVTDS